jgi:hypothetical protein
LASAFIVMSAPLRPPKSASACVCHGRASPVTRPPTLSGVEVKLLHRLKLDERGDNDGSLSDFSFINQPSVVSSLGMITRGRAARTPPVATGESPLSMPLRLGGSVCSVGGGKGPGTPGRHTSPAPGKGSPSLGLGRTNPLPVLSPKYEDSPQMCILITDKSKILLCMGRIGS